MSVVVVADGPDDSAVNDSLAGITRSLQAFRPDLRIHLARLGGVSPSLPSVIDRLVSDDVGEVVLVPLDLVSAAEHVSEYDDFPHSPDIHVVVSRPVGPASEVLNILDERVREALHRGGDLVADFIGMSARDGLRGEIGFHRFRFLSARSHGERALSQFLTV